MLRLDRLTKLIPIFAVLIGIIVYSRAPSASAVAMTPLHPTVSYAFLPSPDYTQNDEKAILRISEYDLPMHNVAWKDPQGTFVSCGTVCITNYEYGPGGTLIAARWEFYIAGRSLPSGTYTAVVTICTLKQGSNCLNWSLWFQANFTIRDVTYPISGNAGVGEATLSYFDGTPKTSDANAIGVYTVTVPGGWSGMVTPSKANYIFTPASMTYTNVQQTYSGQDYTATEIHLTLLPMLRR